MTATSREVSRQPGIELYSAMLLTLVAPTFTMALLPPALPMLARYLGGGERGEILAQRAQSLPFLGLAIGGLVAGAMISRLGLRRCLTAAALAYAAAGLAGGCAQTATLLLASCFIVGFAASLLSSGLTTVTGAAFVGSARTRVLGFQTALSDVAAIGGGITAAILAQLYGWRGPFIIYVLFGSLMVLLIARARLPVLVPERHASNALAIVARNAAGPYLAAGALFFIMGTQPSLLPFHLAANGLAVPGSRALVLTSTPLLAMLASLAYGLLRDRIRDSWMILISAAASTLGYSLIAFWHGGMIQIVLAAMATGIGMGLCFPLVIRAVFQRTAAELHAHSIGLLNTVVFSSSFLSPLVLGPVFRIAGPKTLFLFCAAIWLATGLAVAIPALWRIAQSRSRATAT